MDKKHQYNEYAKEKIESKILDRLLVFRLLSYLKPYRWILLLAILFLIVSKGIEAALPIFIGNISQKILNALSLAPVERSLLFSGIAFSCIVIMALFLLCYVMDTIIVGIKSWVGQKALYELRMQIYEHILHMPLAYFDASSVGRLMTRTIHDVDQINQLFAESVIPIVGNLFLFACIFIAILFMNWKIGILVLCILPSAWWLTHRFRVLQRRCYNRIRTVVSAMNTFVQENLMGATTIRNFGLQSQSRHHFDEINADYCESYVESVRHFAFFIAGIDFLQSVSLIAAFVIVMSWSTNGAVFEAGTYFTFSLYTLMFFRPLADLAERYNLLQSAIAAAMRLFDVMDRQTELAKDKGIEPILDIESIGFEDVWFAYEKDNWVLKGITFTINKGESVALVGVTGEGKTTIISLLLRFYDYQKGIIKINGRDIREYPLEVLRRQFSVVLQDPVIFFGTVSDNISMFNPAIAREEIEHVVDYLGMRQFINHLPKGVDQYLSEHGKSLSVGQKQMVSLARAVVHSRPGLILDEATANIDSTTEKLIQEALKKSLQGRTALVIAHRFSTIKDVSRILVLHGGKIAESGTHRELVDAKGIYEKLYRLQFMVEKNS